MLLYTFVINDKDSIWMHIFLVRSMKAISTMKTELIPCFLWFFKYSQFLFPFLSVSLFISFPPWLRYFLTHTDVPCSSLMVFSPYFHSLSHAKGRVSMKQWATREIGTRGLGEYMYLCKSGRGLHSVSSKTSLLRWSPRQSVCLRDACFEVFVCSVWIWFWIESHYPPPPPPPPFF